MTMLRSLINQKLMQTAQLFALTFN